MPVDIGLWRLDDGIQRLLPMGMPSEKRLEDLIETDPSVLGQPLLLIGRQVPTVHGKYVDLLALDGDGAIHVLELKRDKTPRDVVAQALDYGSWVQDLSHEDVLAIYAKYTSDKALDVALEVAFEEAFGVTLPEELNTGHFLTVVASYLDAESERIVTYLAGAYGVPINAVFFRYFSDGDREYVARTWLRDQQQEAGPKTGSAARQKEQWNGKDWYISFGDDAERSWEDAREHGFVSAGGGDWYSRSLRSVPEGARVWTCIPKLGYVGVGTVTGPAQRFADSRFAQIPHLVAPYVHPNGEDEWVLPVAWIATVPKSQAVWQKGMFANQNSGARLRNSFTLGILHGAFPGIDE
ncbi:MAG TPA: hypothetical protein VFE45_13050 [Coriobacteriia bacterium]|nr:hypothetical protein [Coriobacteriia bacterium]